MYTSRLLTLRASQWCACMFKVVFYKYLQHIRTYLIRDIHVDIKTKHGMVKSAPKNVSDRRNVE